MAYRSSLEPRNVGDILIAHPGILLYEIWKNPDIAHYVKTLRYHNQDVWAGGHYDYAHVDSITLSKLRDYGEELLERCVPFPIQDREKKLELLYQGDETQAFAILLSLLPNLTELHMIRCYWDVETIQGFIDRIRSASHDPDRPLQNLKTVSATGYHDDIVSLNHFMAFGCLPSVKTLFGLRVLPNADFVPTTLDIFGNDEYAAVESLTLQRCLLGIKDVRKILSRTTKLSEFTYHHEAEGLSPIVNGDNSFVAGFLTEAVAELCGKTVQKSRLSSGRDPEDAIEHFLAFETLLELEIDASFLLSASETDEDEVDVPALVDILPRSLEALFINLGDVAEADVPRFFQGWEEKRLKSPNLSCLTHGVQKLGNALREMIKATNVRVFYRKKWGLLESLRLR